MLGQTVSCNVTKNDCNSPIDKVNFVCDDLQKVKLTHDTDVSHIAHEKTISIESQAPIISTNNGAIGTIRVNGDRSNYQLSHPEFPPPLLAPEGTECEILYGKH